MTDYATALRTADWARWPGLPAGLHERELLRILGIARPPTSRHDGRLSRNDVVIVDAGDVRYWLRDGDHVALVQLTTRLGATTPADLLARLGPPDRAGPGRYLQSGATTTEYVFAGRGIAVTVGESYDTPPSFPPRLAAVQLFSPATTQAFVLELGGNDRAGPSY